MAGTKVMGGRRGRGRDARLRAVGGLGLDSEVGGGVHNIEAWTIRGGMVYERGRWFCFAPGEAVSRRRLLLLGETTPGRGGFLLWRQKMCEMGPPPCGGMFPPRKCTCTGRSRALLAKTGCSPRESKGGSPKRGCLNGGDFLEGFPPWGN